MIARIRGVEATGVQNERLGESVNPARTVTHDIVELDLRLSQEGGSAIVCCVGGEPRQIQQPESPRHRFGGASQRTCQPVEGGPVAQHRARHQQSTSQPVHQLRVIGGAVLDRSFEE
jgi:hypothetical protein